MIATKLSAFYQPLIGFLPQIGLACVLLFGGRRVVSGHMTLGDFTAFYTYLLMLLGPMRSLGMSLGLAQRATASGARIFELLDRRAAIAAPVSPLPLPAGSGRVELRDVCFGYEGAPGPTLHDVSLDVAEGTTVALVGATGSGKTTLVALLPRLYDVTAGAVLIDGADVRDVDPVELRQAIAVVDDAPFLFSTTIADNIAYARGGAEHVAMEEIELAARRAQAHDFIAALPDGYATRVGERGLTLSGGQRQRVAIARALLADPRVLVFDDATSAVDASTEQAIKEALREAMAGRTTFVIAHRLSTIALADRIVVVEDGRIAAEGTHEELLGVVTVVRRDRREGTAGPGLLEPQPDRAGGGGAVRSEQAEGLSRRDDLRRRLRETGGRGRKLRGIVELLRPYRTRTALMFVALVIGTAAVAGARAAGQAGDRPGHHQGRPRRAGRHRGALHRQRADRLGRRPTSRPI